MKYVSEEEIDWDLYLDSVLFSYRVSKQDSTKASPFMLVYGRQPRLPIELSVNAANEEKRNEKCPETVEEETSEKKEEMGLEEDETSLKGERNDEEEKCQEGLDDEEMNQVENEMIMEEKTHSLEDGEDDGNKKDAHGIVCRNITAEDHIMKMIEIRKKALGNIKIAQKKQKMHCDPKHCKDKCKYKVGALVLLKNSKKLSRKGCKQEPNWFGPYRIHEVGTVRLSSLSNKVLAQTYNMTRLKLYYQKSPVFGQENPVHDIPPGIQQDDTMPEVSTNHLVLSPNQLRKRKTTAKDYVSPKKSRISNSQSKHLYFQNSPIVQGNDILKQDDAKPSTSHVSDAQSKQYCGLEAGDWMVIQKLFGRYS